MWVDKRLNYGREHIHSFAQSSLPFSNVLDIGAGIGTDLDVYTYKFLLINFVKNQ